MFSQMDNIAKLLRSHLDERRISADDFAARIGVSRGSVYAWLKPETEKKNMSAENALDLAHELGTTVEELFGRRRRKPFEEAQRDNDIRATQIAIRSLARALAQTIPGAISPLADWIDKEGEGLDGEPPFATDSGLLLQVLNICGRVPKSAANDAPVPRQVGSAKRSK
jgi:transcriptional regulator with XRE-family HTH domain